jgi:hypothetical protein
MPWTGSALREIAGKLNTMLMPTKQGGTWQSNTVRVILARAWHARVSTAPGTGALFGGSVEADSMRTRCNVRVAALSWEEGQGHRGRTPRVPGPRKLGKENPATARCVCVVLTAG